MYCDTMTQTNTGKRTKMISFRASDEEIQRIKALSAELIEKNRYLKESDILIAQILPLHFPKPD